MSSSLYHSLIASLLLVICSMGRGDDSQDAIGALKQFLDSKHLSEQEQVLGMVGFYGTPRPPQWLILSSMAGKKDVLRESVFARGEVVAERKFSKLPGQDLPHIPIVVKILEFGSGEVFSIAETMAVERRVAFDSVHYQLRCRKAEKEPVWLLSLINSAQVTVGVIYISAVSGEVLWESWPHLASEKAPPPLTQN